MRRIGTTRVVALAIAVPMLAGAYFLGSARSGGTARGGETGPAGRSIPASTIGVGAPTGSTASIAEAARAGAAIPAIAGAASIGTAGSGAAAGAPPANPPGGITVSGVGKVTGTPDTVLVNMALSVSAGNVSSALASANEKTDAVQKVLLGRGVDPKDLQTSGLNIFPTYSGGSGPQSITGYQVQESLTAKVRDLSKAGDTISAAVAAGGDAIRVDGVSLDLGDTSPLVAAARDRAFGAARSEAAQYAKAAGVPLGRVMSISEAFSQNPMPVYGAQAAGVPSASAAVPIKGGSQDVSVTVTVVFALG